MSAGCRKDVQLGGKNKRTSFAGSLFLSRSTWAGQLSSKSKKQTLP
jgi:hypothetical protein